MFSNYPYGPISKNSSLSSHNEFRSIQLQMFMRITNFIFRIRIFVWFVITRHSILRLEKEIFSKERSSLISPNSKFSNTKQCRSVCLWKFLPGGV
jgi:hypothetical protein